MARIRPPVEREEVENGKFISTVNIITKRCK